MNGPDFLLNPAGLLVPETSLKRVLSEWEVRVKAGLFALNSYLILNAWKYYQCDESGVSTRKLEVGPMGGSALITDASALNNLHVQNYFNVPLVKGADAKLIVPKSQIGQLIDYFTLSDCEGIESSLDRELFEELTHEKFLGRMDHPILTEELVEQIKIKYKGIVAYWTERSEDGWENLSINRVYRLDMPKKVRDILDGNPSIFVPKAHDWKRGYIRKNWEIITISKKAKILHDFVEWRLPEIDEEFLK